ncbi:hypothetical protein MPDQ_005210 [Monascus purpureus]|uniref:Uncharacterized protein n=1 Tax=Monascus purpureus TaxID=5098 RepID=A0A507R067_MONPU|nr:hypothetical protein MPDQ_005210 [Monascus purpureus]
MDLDIDHLLPRQANLCTNQKLWYVCTAGNFHGCCSTDPCTTGVCPDDDRDGESSTVTTPTVAATLPASSSSTSSTTISSSTSSTNATISSSLSSAASVKSSESSNMATSITTDTVKTASTSSSQINSVITVTASMDIGPSPSSAASSSERDSGSTGGLIGGAVGSILGALMVMGLIVLLCRRRRKQLRRGRIPHDNNSWKKIASAENSPISPLAGPRELNMDPHTPLATLASITNTPRSATELLSRTRGVFDHRTTTNATVFDNSTAHVPELPATFAGHSGTTPELPDTGFYRPRAELATHSQSELINVPFNQRSRSPPIYGMVQNDPCLDSGSQFDSQGDSGNNDRYRESKSRNLYQPVLVPAPALESLISVTRDNDVQVAPANANLGKKVYETERHDDHVHYGGGDSVHVGDEEKESS